MTTSDLSRTTWPWWGTVGVACGFGKVWASIRHEIRVKASPEAAWDATRDIGALHERLVTGFVVDTRLEAGARIATFGNGLVVKELIVDLDDAPRRLVWSARSGRLEPPQCINAGLSRSRGGCCCLDLRPAAGRYAGCD